MTSRLALVLVCASGCSFIGVQVPDAVPATGKLECSYAAPIADTVVAVPAMGIAAATGIATLAEGDGGGAVYGFVFLGLPLLVPGVITTASAIYGYRAEARCSGLEAKRASLATPPATE